MYYDKELFGALIDQTDTAVSQAGGRNNLPQWIEHNTRHPKEPLKPWSFAGHEFQRQILEDVAPHIVVRKAAQKGVSEVVVRFVLALLAKLSGEHAIYVLPSKQFAGKFAVSRFDPVIESSERLKRLKSKAIDSSELKKIGSCFLWIGGAQKEDQAISVPARILIRDEYSFGDPAVLSTYQSRLEHVKPKDRIILDFSTPLYPEMGIDVPYEQGTKYIYMCFHDRCGNWTEVDSLRHIILPGFDNKLVQLTKQDLDSPRVKPKEAWLRCSCCGAEITQENLADPLKRAWVAHHPDRDIHSYHVDPLCTAQITTPSQVIAGLALYDYKIAKWVQYGLGQPFQSADSQIVDAALKDCFLSERLPPGVSAVSGAAAGMDVGKVSYLVHGRMLNGRLHVFNMETVRQDGENVLGVTFVERFRGYRCVRGVIDSEPDVSIVKYAQANTIWNAVWGCYFVRSAHKSTLNLFESDEVKGVVNARRTQVFDSFVADFNAGKILLPRGMQERKQVEDHLKRPKRIVREDSLGEEAATWVSHPENHWFLALLYLWLATRMMVEDDRSQPIAAAAAKVTTARMRTEQAKPTMERTAMRRK